MDRKIMINIGREYGSGGKEIGLKLAEALDIPFYDRELIERASRESGISEELFNVVEEQQTHSFLYSLAMGAYSYGSRLTAAGTVSMSDRLYLIQADIIKQIAKEGSAVIVGRCANYILKDFDCVNVFVCGSLENRIKRICEREDISPDKAKDKINKIDKKRSSYYNYYTSEKWGSRKLNELILNSDVIGVDGCVKLIQEFIKLKFGE